MPSSTVPAGLLQLVHDGANGTSWKFLQSASLTTAELRMEPRLQKLREVHESLAARGSTANVQAPFWWLTVGVDATIATRLGERHFCVIDGFLGPPALSALAREVCEAHQAGRLHDVSKVGTGHMHTGRDTRQTQYHGCIYLSVLYSGIPTAR